MCLAKDKENVRANYSPAAAGGRGEEEETGGEMHVSPQSHINTFKHFFLSFFPSTCNQ